MSKRPEHLAPPEFFYNEDEARKYTRNTRMIEIQSTMTERAVELLALPDDEPRFLLDIGCGSGLSGEVLEEQGHFWIGLDISEAMLKVATERESIGDKILSDMGEGVPFRAGSFDGAISISALQWLCNRDKTTYNPARRLTVFFTSLYAALRRGSRAVFQFYPENSSQIELITQQAMKAGFSGGVVVDFPNSSKAKKIFLVLMTGGAAQLPTALGVEEQTERPSHVKYENRRERVRNVRARKTALKGSRNWVMAKKERQRQQGKDVRPDSKYTGRKRPGRI